VPPDHSSLSAAVLIVEDEPEFRRAFERMVRSAPDLRLIGSAGTVAEAFAWFDRERVDVLLVDLGLPDGSGISVIQEATRRWPTCCDVMVVSVFADQRNILAAIEAGATGYLLKDTSPTSFIQQIRELRAGGSPVSPLIARQLIMRFAPPRTTKFAAPGGSVSLSPSETEVLRYAARGYSYDEVAKLMGVSRHTVMSYVKRIYTKLQVHSKTEALYEARRMGLVAD
jgi:DNA-binding NarL/FixJ family response regulator